MNSKESDENTIYMINLGTSINTGGLVFFILIPALLAVVAKTLHLSPRTDSTLTNTIHFILYYVLDIVAVILAIKWQKKKLANKSLNFRKKYLLAVSSTFLLLILVQHLW
jgi:undecaprenyl pyrophosphate phosphatase UppP